MGAAVVPLIGVGITALGTVVQSEAKARSDEFSAEQLERNANEAEAASQRVAEEDRRKAEVLKSRARAAAAMATGSASDVGTLDLISKIDAAGEYNALSALYAGKQAGGGLRTMATSSRYGAKSARTAGNISALSTIMSGAASAYPRFGSSDTGPNPNSNKKKKLEYN